MKPLKYIRLYIAFGAGVWFGMTALVAWQHEKVLIGVEPSSHIELAQTKARIEQLEARLHRSIASSLSSESMSVDRRNFTNSHWVCQKLTVSGVLPSADFLWNQNLQKIHRASQLLRNDPHYIFNDFTAQLLALVSPRLPLGLGFSGADPEIMERLMDRIKERVAHVRDRNLPEVPRIKILVFGGSVLVGRNCRKLVKDLGQQNPMPNRECNWAHRLKMTLEQLFPDVFLVTKIAMGGTNTAVGTTVFRYDLVPPESRDPDVVVNAYSTNDMHILTVLEATSGNQTLRDRVMEMLQEFVRTVLSPAECKATPLLLHLDDYIGNEQREIMGTAQMLQSVSLLASYYKFPTISYANVIREFVYYRTEESWFSPEGWYLKGEKGMQREIHPGMGAHISIVWVVLYGLLNTLLMHCGSWQGADGFEYEKSPVAQQVPLWPKPDFRDIPGKPERPLGLPPPLLPNSTLDQISAEWRSTTRDNLSSAFNHNSVCAGQQRTRCIFSWIGGLSLQQNDKKLAQQYFDKFLTTKGWKLDNDGDKLGFTPHRKGDTMSLEFRQLEQPIKSVTLFYMKSYGAKWKDSQASMAVQTLPAGANTWSSSGAVTLEGIHDKKTSEMYTNEVALNPVASVGNSLRLTLTLTGGTTFKVMGLAVCS